MKKNAFDKISEYFKNCDGAEPVTQITQVARTIGVSESSIVRFCQKKGYSGFKDFALDLAKQRGLNEGIGLGVDMPTEELSSGNSLQNFVKNILLTNCNAIINTIESINYETLQKVIDGITSAHNIFVMGYGNSAPIAMDITLRLSKLGFSCFSNSEPFADAQTINTLKKGDLLIAVSYSGSTTSIINGLKIAKENNVQGVLLTSTADSPASDCCDLQLVTERGNAPDESIATRVAQLSLMDAIFARLVVRAENSDKYKQHVLKIAEYLAGLHSKFRRKED